jgi:hypothetical protein
MKTQAFLCAKWNHRMAIANQALRPVRQLARRFRLAPTSTKLLILPTILCAFAVASCAQNVAQHDIETSHIRARVAAHVRDHTQPRPRRLDPALLTPQPAPDCEFDGPDPKTVDPDQWARLKLDYERQCYRKAEKIVRQRLVLLQQALDNIHR